MVGLGGFEPPTLRLSGVRSNQLSYRPSLLEAASKTALVLETATRQPCGAGVPE